MYTFIGTHFSYFQLGYHEVIPRDGCDGGSILSVMKLPGGFAPSSFIL